MKNTKFRILSLVLVVVLLTAVVLTGCKTTDTGPAPTPTPTPDPEAVPAPEPEVTEYEWPKNLKIQSSTGVGQEQWVSFTSLMTNDTGMNILVVPEQNAALRFANVQSGDYFASAGGATDFQNVTEALTTFASEDGGPFQARYVWTYGEVSSGFLVADNSDIKTIDDVKAGVRLPNYTRSPNIKNKQFGGLLAWAGLTADDAVWVDFGSYNSMQQGIADGKIDVTFAFLHSSILVEVASGPNGLRLLELPYDTDPEGAARYLELNTTTSFGIVERTSVPAMKGGRSMASITGIAATADADEELVYNFSKWMAENYVEYKDAHAQNAYMGLEGMKTLMNTSFVPIHDGTIKYLKEIGLWKDANDARQAANIALMTQYVDAYAAAITAAEAQGISVSPENDDWQAFWTKWKEDNSIPKVATFPGLD